MSFDASDLSLLMSVPKLNLPIRKSNSQAVPILNPFYGRGVHDIRLVLCGIHQFADIASFRIPQVKGGAKTNRHHVVVASIHQVEVEVVYEIRGIEHLFRDLWQVPLLLVLQLVCGGDIIDLCERLGNRLWFFIKILVV